MVAALLTRAACTAGAAWPSAGGLRPTFHLPQVVQHMLLNLRLWAPAAEGTQMELHRLLHGLLKVICTGRWCTCCYITFACGRW